MTEGEQQGNESASDTSTYRSKVGACIEGVNSGAKRVQRRIFVFLKPAYRFSEGKYEDFDDNLSEIDFRTVSMTSMFVFVLSALLVSSSAIIDLEGFLTFLIEREIWEGFGRNIEDEGSIPRGGYLPFITGSEAGPSITNLGRVAFIVVIGQVIHQINIQLFEQARPVSAILMGLFTVMLIFAFTATFPSIWVLIIQIIILCFYFVTFLLVLSRKFYKHSQLPDTPS